MNPRTGDKTAVIFGGGGGKGAYQIGVWQIMREIELDKYINAAAGTSVGALNGALFAAGNLNTAVCLWENLREEQILSPKGGEDSEAVSKWPSARDEDGGWFSHAGLRRLIWKNLDFAAVQSGRIDFYATAARLLDSAKFYKNMSEKTGDGLIYTVLSAMSIKKLGRETETVYFRMKGRSKPDIVNIMLASSAIPVVFPEIKIDGGSFVDGGIRDNVPITPLYEAGYRRFLIITLGEATDEARVIKGYKKDFPNSEFLILNSDEKNKMQDMTGTLNFTAKAAKERMKKGREDAAKRADEIKRFVLNER